jgi:hypothetical protein
VPLEGKPCAWEWVLTCKEGRSSLSVCMNRRKTVRRKSVWHSKRGSLSREHMCLEEESREPADAYLCEETCVARKASTRWESRKTALYKACVGL